MILRTKEGKHLKAFRYIFLKVILMRRSLIILFFVILSPLTYLALPISSQSTPIQGYATSNELITPGEIEVPITFHLINLGQTLTDVTIIPADTYPFYLYPYNNGTELTHIPLWNQGQTVNVTYLFDIASAAKTGTYTDVVIVQGVTTSGTQATYDVLVPVVIAGYVNFSASSVWGTTSNPMVVGPGENNIPLTIILQNLGNSLVTNITLELNSQFPVKFLQNNATISAIPAGYYGEATVMASVYPNVTQGLYYIRLNIIYYHNATTTVLVPIDIGSSNQVSLEDAWGTPSDPIVAAPGETLLPLTIYVKNLGENLLSNVMLILQSHYPIQFLQNYTMIGFVPAGGYNYVTVVANVYKNVTPGVYYVPITLVAYDGGFMQTFEMPVYILGYVNFSASSVWGTTSNPMVVGPGENNIPLTIILQNTGIVSITNATLFLQSQYPVEFLQNNVTIGNIPVGYPIPVTVLANVYPNVTNTGVYYITAKVMYYDGVIQYVKVPIYIQSLNQVSVEGVWGSLSNPLLVAPGENNVPLTIVIKNLGENLMTNVSLILQSHYPIQFLQQNASVGFVPAGSYNYVTVTANVFPNATPGVYYIPATLVAYGGFKENIMITVDILGYITIQAQSLWGGVTSPITVSSGENDVPLTILLKNTGDVNILNATLVFQNVEYPLIFHQTNAQIGIVPAGQENYATVTVSVFPNATPGVYYIPATLYYFNHKTTITIPITIYSPNISVNLITIPPQVFPSYYDVRLLVILTNFGGGIAENANVSIRSPFQVISSNPLHLGALPVGVPVNATFLINVPNDTIPKTYIINVTITYDGGKETYQYPLQIYPKANLIVVGVSYPSLSAGDSNVPITITLKNNGNSTAKNVIVRLGTSNLIYPHVSSSNPLQALTASEVFAGDIAPGQTINVTFVVDVSSGASSGTYPLAIALIWNQTGSLFPFEQSDTFYVTISPPFYEQFFKSPAGIITVIVIIIIIIVIVTVLLRVRNKRK
ncbi:hypothetical protein GO599_10555 [Sulfolobus islandicus]|uniref:COG1361 S-layer family protein n=1 Tax=Saccharolobus islandicus TaxID=43080 RepID=UPI0023496D0E|nr:hypothetical protein [Sulfolobus islandicus]WCM37851.1 hypothetical protein GO599_10555 [Sulfolobus islandicus]